MGDFALEICKREKYQEAWKYMYFNNKAKDIGFNHPMFDGVNPTLNKKLDSEFDNICIVCYDKTINNSELSDLNMSGLPVGIFSMVLTVHGNNIKVIGKQWVVDPRYQHKGIASAMCMVLEDCLKKYEHPKYNINCGDIKTYYIGCSHCSAPIQMKHGNIFYNDEENAKKHDLYKFNVDLNRRNWNEQYKKEVIEKGFSIKEGLKW